MYRLMLLIPLAFFFACGPAPQDGEDGSSCSTSPVDGGALISCEDGTETFVENGNDGSDGTACYSNDVDGGVLIECDDGSEYLVHDGADGTDGIDGQDGSSCSANEVDGGVEITCGDDSPVLVSDGVDGQDGVDGTNAVQDYATLLWSKRLSVIDVRAWDENDELLGRCTGTKTQLGNVITASHCFPDETASITYQQSTAHLGQGGEVLWYSSEGRDIVEVVNPQWNASGAALPGLQETSNAPLAVGDMVGNLSIPLNVVYDVQAAVGFVNDEDVSASLGYDGFWSEAFMADYAAAGGSSGSPVFNDEGKWIGIHVGGFTSLEISIALPFE